MSEAAQIPGKAVGAPCHKVYTQTRLSHFSHQIIQRVFHPLDVGIGLAKYLWG